MSQIVRFWGSTITLMALSCGGFYGGISLVKDSTGQALGMSPEVIHLLPISSFLLPGIFILVVFGVLPLINASWILLAQINDQQNGNALEKPLRMAFCIGLVLIGWMAGQFLLMGYWHPPFNYSLPHWV